MKMLDAHFQLPDSNELQSFRGKGPRDLPGMFMKRRSGALVPKSAGKPAFPTMSLSESTPFNFSPECPSSSDGTPKLVQLMVGKAGSPPLFAFKSFGGCHSCSRNR